MKSIKTFSLALLMLIALSTKAQNKPFSLSVGAGYSSFKANNISKSSSGLGADLMIKTDLSENIQGFAQTGYNAYLNNGFNVAYIPLLIGANVKFNNFSTGLGRGYGSSTAGGSTKGGFTISPQLSIHINNIDLVVHYTSTKTNAASTWNMLGLKIMHKIF